MIVSRCPIGGIFWIVQIIPSERLQDLFYDIRCMGQIIQWRYNCVEIDNTFNFIRKILRDCGSSGPVLFKKKKKIQILKCPLNFRHSEFLLKDISGILEL